MLVLSMNKLIIGATGAIGSALARKLVGQGKSVHLVARNESEAVSYTHLTLPTNREV